MNKPTDNSRRDFLKKTAYVVPVILTLQAAPSLAGIGSQHRPPTEGGGVGGPHGYKRKKQHRDFFQSCKNLFRKIF